MKGMVFTEFLDLVENSFGLEVLDELIVAADLPNGGAYTAVGTYPHTEMVSLVGILSRITEIPVHKLLQIYGEHMFPQLIGLHADMVKEIKDPFDLFSKIHDYIHVEVAKLYPDAELPRFSCARVGDDSFKLEYHSSRPFGSLAEGLITGCGKHYGQHLEIARDPAPEISETDVVFTITRQTSQT